MRELPKNVVVVDTEPVWVKNPYTGAGVMLDPDAVAVYDFVKGCEMFRDYDNVRKGCDWFKKKRARSIYGFIRLRRVYEKQI